MPSVKSIKQRIKSVKNTRQITKAMEAVSATKMRRSQRSALDGRPYALAALEMLGNVMQRTQYRPSLLVDRPIRRAVLVVVTSDKGLAGAFNASVLRKADRWITEHAQQYPVDIITVGKKARDYFSGADVPARTHADKTRNDAETGLRDSALSPRDSAFRRKNVVKEFLGFGDYAKPNETKPLSDFLLKGFSGTDMSAQTYAESDIDMSAQTYAEKTQNNAETGLRDSASSQRSSAAATAARWDLVEIIYTNFRTTLKQEVAMARIFPVNLEKIKQTIENIIPEHGRFANATTNYSLLTTNYEYKLEPSAEAVLDALIPHLIETQIFHMILESNASEHSARMVAMKNASENAGEIISELTLEYNKSRQAGITRELTEITAGKEALEQ